MYQSQVSGFSILKNEIGQYFDFGHNMGIENIRITHLPTIENAALKIRADGQYATYPSGRLPSDDESMYPFLRRAIEKKDLVLLKRLLTGADPAFSKEMYGLMPGNEVIQTAIPQNESLSDDDLGKRYLLFRMALVNKPAEAFKYIPETMNQAMFVAFLGIALDSPNNVKMMEYLTVKPEFADLVSAIINLDRKDATIDDRIYAVDFDPIVIDNLQKSLIAACESERNNENAIKTFVR